MEPWTNLHETSLCQAKNQRPGPAQRNIDPAAKRKPLSVRNVDVSELQIDETFDTDCDPYNSTGQFLADAVRKKYDDQ